MKRAALIIAVFAIANWATAQTQNPPTQNPPSGGQAAPSGQAPQGSQPGGQATPGAAGGQAAPGAQPTPPAGKRPPQAKTQPEYDAYKAAATGTDPAAMEKAADDFATKFPDSELRILLYKNAQRAYQSTNNPDKTEAMGRKVLSLDPDDPEALVMVAEVIAEKTHDTDLDKEQRYDEATKMAQKATQTVETDVSVPAGTPQDKLDAYKNLLRSNAYSIIGTIEFKKDNFTAAQADLQKSIDAFPSQPDPVVVLRLALSLDRQQKYPDALKIANQAVDVAHKNQNQQIETLATRERDRLTQLTGGTAAPTTQQPESKPPQN